MKETWFLKYYRNLKATQLKRVFQKLYINYNILCNIQKKKIINKSTKLNILCLKLFLTLCAIINKKF